MYQNMDTLNKARSLYSKALPPPPPSSDNGILIRNGNSKDVGISNGNSHSITTGMFPPRTTSTKPFLSPLPLKFDSPFSRLQDQEQAAPSPSKVDTVRPVVHRRPVALPSSPRPSTTTSAPVLAPIESYSLSPVITATRTTTIAALATSPLSASALAPASPAYSISSLISAYSKDSEVSALPQPSQDTETSKNLFYTSPSHPISNAQKLNSPFTLPPLDFKDAPSSTNMFGEDRPPPPPVKDGVVPARKPLPVPSSTSNGSSAQGVATNFAAPVLPPHEDEKPLPPAEIWKRRSDKTDKPLGVSELKLTATNGSTLNPRNPTQPVPDASSVKSPYSQQNLLQQPNSNTSTPDSRLRSPLPPRSGGLPGRNVRPTATAETPTQNGSGVPTAASGSLSKIGTISEAKMTEDGTPADKEEKATLQSQRNEAVRQRPHYHVQKQSEQQQEVQQQQPLHQSYDAGIRRLPTPDYEKHDVKSPIVEHVVSPASPASSPDLIGSHLEARKPLPHVRTPSTTDTPPPVPEKNLTAPASIAANNPASPGPRMGNICTFPKSPRPRVDTKESSASSTRGSETTKAQGSVEAPSAVQKTAGSSTRSLTDPVPAVEPALAPAPATTSPDSKPQPASLQLRIPQNTQSQGQTSPLSPSVDSGYNANSASPRDQFPTRTISRGQGLPSSPLAGLPSSPLAMRIKSYEQNLAEAASVTEAFLESDAGVGQISTTIVRPSTSQQQHQPRLLSPYEPRASPSDGTIYKDIVQSDEFSPAVARFPVTKLTSGGVLPGSVHKMRPLSRAQLNCFHRHRFMVPTSNVNYPLACQTCAREDAEDRFRCKFCYLRTCVACKDVLVQNRGDLDALMAHVKSPGFSAHARSGSAQLAAGTPGFPVVTAPA